MSQQPENCENRNDPDLVQAFLKKWGVESDFKAPNLPLSLRLKVSGCHYNSIYNNTWTKQVKQLRNPQTLNHHPNPIPQKEREKRKAKKKTQNC